MKLLKGFNIDKYLNKKPPSDNSFTTMQEIKELAKTPLNKKFAKDKDDIVNVLEKIPHEEEIAQNIINEPSTVIYKIKKQQQRTRTKEQDKK